MTVISKSAVVLVRENDGKVIDLATDENEFALVGAMVEVEETM
jgi:hypothetical protein